MIRLAQSGMWGCCHAPGDKYEMSCSTHVASWEEEEDGDDERVGQYGTSRPRRLPGRVVWIISIMDAKRVD